LPFSLCSVQAAGRGTPVSVTVLVALDSNPTKLIEIVEIGKQLLLMTRDSLTTFSRANDVSKYFAIIPAAFVGTYPVLAKLNVMGLATPASAILSAVVFNALVIVALVPLALRGVKYRAIGAAALLRNNLLVYGLGGLIVPFVGIKLIDLLLGDLGLPDGSGHDLMRHLCERRHRLGFTVRITVP
jgi:K+-transporting ATPase ATPase B chain